MTRHESTTVLENTVVYIMGSSQGLALRSVDNHMMMRIDFSSVCGAVRLTGKVEGQQLFSLSQAPA